MQNIIFYAFVIYLIVLDDIKLVNAEDITLWAGLGGRAELPCPTALSVDIDRPILTLWFKEGHTEAVLSFDSRKKKFPNGVTWSDDIIFGGRATYDASSEPPRLILEPVLVEDDSLFTCRTDYLKSPSSHASVKLSVAIPPDSPVITWSEQEIIGSVGPINEGQHIELICQTKGGRPPPTLSWWQHGRQMQAEERVEESDDGPITKSSLSLIAARSFHETPLVCHARASHSDHSIARPQTTAVTLNITLPPLSVQISDIPDPVSAGRTINPICTSVGSHPPVEISWWKAGRRLTQVIRTILPGGNVTTATVTLRITKDDHGTTISCRTNNPVLPTRQMIDTAVLNVYFPPEINLRIGKNLNLSYVIEGQDIFLVCDVESNPPHHRLEWFFQGKPLSSSHGAIMSATSLVLQSLRRAQAGSYSCRVTNLEGQSQSNELELNVHYPPFCEKGNEKRTQGAAVGHPSTLECKVDANPDEQLKFRWSRPMPGGRETTLVDFDTRHLVLTPSISEDFGQFFCRAINSVGEQRDPCVIILVTAGPPEPVRECGLQTTAAGVEISCRKGFHGGFPQQFLLTAWQKDVMLFNESRIKPTWKLQNLSRSDKINFEVIAMNAKGISPPSHLQLHALVAHQQATTESSQKTGDMSLIGAIILGALVSLLLILLGALIFVQRTRITASRKRNSKENSDNECDSFQRVDLIPNKVLNKSDQIIGDANSLSSYDSLHGMQSPTHSAPITTSRSHNSLYRSIPDAISGKSYPLSPERKHSFSGIHYNSCQAMDTDELWTNSYRRECRRKARRAALLQKRNSGSLYLGTTDGTSSAGSENTAESPLLSEKSNPSETMHRKQSFSNRTPSCPHKNIRSPHRYFDPHKPSFPIIHYSTTPRLSRAQGKIGCDQTSIDAWKRNRPFQDPKQCNGTVKNNTVSKISGDDQRESRV